MKTEKYFLAALFTLLLVIGSSPSFAGPGLGDGNAPDADGTGLVIQTVGIEDDSTAMGVGPLPGDGESGPVIQFYLNGNRAFGIKPGFLFPEVEEIKDNDSQDLHPAVGVIWRTPESVDVYLSVSTANSASPPVDNICGGPCIPDGGGGPKFHPRGPQVGGFDLNPAGRNAGGAVNLIPDEFDDHGWQPNPDTFVPIYLNQ